jgi:hypothetical protein
MKCEQSECLWCRNNFCSCVFVSEVNLSFLDASKKYLMCGNFTTQESKKNEDSGFLLTETNPQSFDERENIW